MTIEVTVRHGEAGTALQAYARGKAEALEAEFPRVERVHVILGAEKRMRVAEVVVQAGNHVRAEAAEEAANPRQAVDWAFEKIEKQLRRTVDKIQDHKSAMKHFEARRSRGVQS